MVTHWVAMLTLGLNEVAATLPVLGTVAAILESIFVKAPDTVVIFVVAGVLLLLEQFARNARHAKKPTNLICFIYVKGVRTFCPNNKSPFATAATNPSTNQHRRTQIASVSAPKDNFKI